jgi:hypothetical protein
MRSTLWAVPVFDSCPYFRREHNIPKKHAELLIKYPNASEADLRVRFYEAVAAQQRYCSLTRLLTSYCAVFRSLTIGKRLLKGF